MNLKYAQYIMEVARQKSITTAAQKLYISQPSLSQIISKTEKDLKVLLFDRTSNGLHLTKAGEMYIEAMESAMLIDQNLRRKLSEDHKATDICLRIGISTQRVIDVLPEILPQVLQEYPDIRLSIQAHSSSILEDMINEGALDVALAMTSPHNDELTYVMLEKEDVILYAGKNTALAKKYPNKSTIDISAARNERFVCLTPGHNSRSIQDRLFFAYDISPEIILEANDMQIAIKMVDSLDAVMICLFTYLRSPFSASLNGNYYYVNHVARERDLYAIYKRGMFLNGYFQDLLKSIEAYFSKKTDDL